MAEPTLQELAGDFRISERTISLGVNATQIAAQDPTRWALWIAKETAANAVNVSTNGAVTDVNGTPIVQNNLPLIINFRDLGGLTQVAWFAKASVAATNITVIEVFYRPQGRVPTPDEMIALSAKMGGKR